MKKILNILLIIMLVITVALVGAAFSTSGDSEVISYNLIWAYVLLGLGVAAVLACAVFGMIKSPSGLKATLIPAILVIATVGAAWGYASGHTIQISDIGNGGFFDAQDTIITEASIIVAYVALVGALLASAFSEIMHAFK